MDATASRQKPAPPLGSGARPSPGVWIVALWADLMALTAYAAAMLLFFWPIVGSGAAPAGLALPVSSYPPDRLFSWLAGADAPRYGIAAHILLGALFTYLFGRFSLRLSPVAAWMAGSVFAFGGFLGAQVEHPSQLRAAVWLPLLLLCLERAVERRRLVLLGVAALAFALQLLAGDLQLAYFSGWTLALFGLWLAVSRGDGDSALRGWRRLLPLGATTLGLAAGFAVAWVLLGPALAAGDGYRPGGFPLKEAVTPSVPVMSLMDSVLPLYFAKPENGLFGYTGVVSLVLLPAALACRWRRGYQWFFVVLGALALLLSLGAETPLYGWLFGTAPGFNLFRAPGRWLLVYSLSVALLAGIGMESLRGPRDAEAFRRWLGGYGLACAAGVAVVVGVRLWLGSNNHDFEFPHPRILLNWWLFAGASFGLIVVTRSWARCRWVLLLLVGLALMDLYLGRAPLW